MKKFVAFLLAMICLLSAFAACTKNEEKKPDDQASGNQNTETPVEPERTYDSPIGEALVTVAEAYLARRNYIQYCDTRLINGDGMGYYYRWESGKNSPEDSTVQYTTYSNCAAFCYDVYYHALGIDIGTNTTQKMMNATDMQVYRHDVTGNETDEEKAKIKAEFTSLLQQGDLIVHRYPDDANGHVMMYVGDGKLIHCTGSNYDYSNNMDVLEARGAIAEMEYESLWVSGEKGLFSKKNFCILRPTIKFTGAEPTDETKSRVNNLKNVVIEKTSSASAGFTVMPGDEITYTFSIRNGRATDATIEIVDLVPSNTEYVSGAQKVDGDELFWSVPVPSGQTVKVTYTVKVKADAKVGDKIYEEGTVGGVTVRCRPVYVGGRLTAEEQAKIFGAVKSNATSSLRGTELAVKIYADIGKNISLVGDAELVNSFFKQVASTKYYKLNYQEAPYMNMLVPTMYGGYFVGLASDLYGAWRTKGPLPSQLMAGDIIICYENNKAQSYMFMGDNLVLDLTSNKQLELTKTVSTLLSTIGFDRFVIVRPAMAN